MPLYDAPNGPESPWDFSSYLLWDQTEVLTLSRRRPLSYRNQSIDWLLYDNGLCLERVKKIFMISCVIVPLAVN